MSRFADAEDLALRPVLVRQTSDTFAARRGGVIGKFAAWLCGELARSQGALLLLRATNGSPTVASCVSIAYTEISNARN